MPDEPVEQKPVEVERGLIGRLNAESDGVPRNALAAANLEIARRKAAGEPEVISPITEAYFKGFGSTIGIADQWAAALPDFAKVAAGFRSGIESERVGFKFMDDKFVESIREALDQQRAPFKVDLAKEALAAFNFDELLKQIRGNTIGTYDSPSLFVEPTPTADLDIVRATIDAPDEPTEIGEVPAEVVTDIQVTRVVIREEIVEALNAALGDRKPKKDTPLWFKWLIGIAALVGVTLTILKTVGVF